MNDEKLRQMILAMEDVKAVLVTLAGRVHDMKSINSLPVLKRQQLAQETLDIFSVVANRLGCWCLKAELEDLAFQTLHPEAYEDVKAQVSSMVTAVGKLTTTSTLPPRLFACQPVVTGLTSSHLTACTVQMMRPVVAGQVPPQLAKRLLWLTHHPFPAFSLLQVRSRQDPAALEATIQAIKAGLDEQGIKYADISGRPKNLYGIWQKMVNDGVTNVDTVCGGYYSCIGVACGCS